MSYDVDYSSFDTSFTEPALEYTPTLRNEAPRWVLQLYYVGTLIMSIVGIITAIGTIVTYEYCSDWKSDSKQTAAETFFGFAFVTLIAALMIFAMSIWALATKQGFTTQVKKAAKAVFKPDEYDRQYAINELQTKIGEQEQSLRMTGLSYPDLQT